MLLIGCIKKCKAFGEIRTRFFSLNEETNDIKDVTIDLCKAINKYNEVSYKIRENGDYSMIIPYKYKDGLAVYSHGCGLSHYLQEDTFERNQSGTFSHLFLGGGSPLFISLEIN